MNFHGGNIHQFQSPVLDFSANINPLGVPETFRRALSERLAEFTCYPDPAYRTVRERIAAYLAIPDPEWIWPGNGAVDLIYKAIRAAGKARVYAVSPTFSEYRQGAWLSGLPYVGLDLLAVNPADRVTALTSQLTVNSLLIVCNPNNPTGALFNRAELAYLAQECARLDCALMVDEAFIEFTDAVAENTILSLLAALPQLLVIRAATKFFGLPGVRLGYGITANRGWLSRIQDLSEPWHLNTAAVIAAETIFTDQEYINRSRRWIEQERSYCFAQLQKLARLTVYPSAANFHLVKLAGDGPDAYRLQAALREHGILIRTPQGFPELSPHHFRVAVKDRRSNERLGQVLGHCIESY